MRKVYPYLQDSYYEDANEAIKRRNFLKTIDDFVNQKQYVKITLLNWKEEPLKEIQGDIVSGSITKDGSSSVRRTCSLSASINKNEYNVEDAKYDFAINKKIFIETGIKNYSNQYTDYPILWFPQGVFFISSSSVSSSASSSVTVQITLKDKMCGLNGDVGGKFPAAVILDEQDTQDASGAYITEKILVYNIIRELVHHYGGEDLNNIVIEDVPLRIKRVMKWTGENPLWLVPHGNTTTSAGSVWYEALLDKPENTDSTVLQIPNGTDCGYVYSDFVYDTELSMNIGESVTSALDKIKQYLGNFEYFYDVFGVFHFREIKNYLNTTQSSFLLGDMEKNDYLVDVTDGKSIYTFSDKNNIISINATPQYDNIKNDFIIQGKRKSTNSDNSIDIRYHLAIDNKPKPIQKDGNGNNIYNSYYNVLLYTEEMTNLTKACFPLHVNSRAELPAIGNFNMIYYIDEESKAVYWNDNTYKDVSIVAYYPIQNENNASTQSADSAYRVKDWRTELYMEGLLAKNLGLDATNYYAKLNNMTDWRGDIFRYADTCRIDTDYYFEELDAFWPQIYDLEKQQFITQGADQSLRTSALTDGNYFLDFIDPQSSGLGQFAISAIGRRTDVVSSDDVNCLFAPEIPNIIFINADSEDRAENSNLIEECISNGIPYTQVRGEIYYALATGGMKNGAFDQVKYELYLHTTYQKSVSITALPVFYLEPNSRVNLNDETTNTYGDYNISSINLTLGAGNTMTVGCNQALERF